MAHREVTLLTGGARGARSTGCVGPAGQRHVASEEHDLNHISLGFWTIMHFLGFFFITGFWRI